MAQLTGAELLAKVKELGDSASKDLVARETGYVATKKDGTERFLYTAFYEALMAAKGIAFAPSPVARAGRSLSYVALVQKTGNLIIGKAYTAAHEAQPGDEFKIEALEDGGFKLTPIFEEAEAVAA
jgi:hypothetical protein